MNRIRELREQKGWRQEDLGEIINKAKSIISRYETGNLGIDADTICKLCDTFGCTADFLLGRSNNAQPSISDSDAALLDMYKAAPREIKAIVDTALAPYRKDATKSSTA